MDETTKQVETPPALLSDPLGWSYRYMRKLLVLVIGFSLLLVGIVLIFTPGPAIVVIPLALSVLAIEFVWAARLLKRMKRVIKSQLSSKQNPTTSGGDPTPPSHSPKQ